MRRWTRTAWFAAGALVIAAVVAVKAQGQALTIEPTPHAGAEDVGAAKDQITLTRNDAEGDVAISGSLPVTVTLTQDSLAGLLSSTTTSYQANLSFKASASLVRPKIVENSGPFGQATITQATGGGPVKLNSFLFELKPTGQGKSFSANGGASSGGQITRIFSRCSGPQFYCGGYFNINPNQDFVVFANGVRSPALPGQSAVEIRFLLPDAYFTADPQVGQRYVVTLASLRYSRGPVRAAVPIAHHRAASLRSGAKPRPL
jgi:hypothetical protein